jgi:lipoprotein-anchoring transpeptidase ErfK/SrfK
MLFEHCGILATQARDHDIMSESGGNSQICLECAAILRHLAVNDPVSAWGYTRAMMIKRILTVLATVAVSTAGTSLALAQGYPLTPGSTYARDPNYPPGGYPADYRDAREAAPDFDALEDDQAPPGRGPVALSPPGPILSPDDPRYGRPVGAPPVYTDRAVPQGPIMSPNDPRYGRPDGPAVIYADRPPGPPPQQTYSDRGDNRVPGAGFIYPNDDRALRPPEAIGPPGAVTGAIPQPPQGADGRPMVLSALPPDEQPEVAPVQLPPHLRRQEVSFVTKEPAGTLVVDTPNTYLYYVLGNNRAVRYGVRVGRDGFTWTGVQKISRKAEWPDWHPPTEMIERQPYLPRFMAGGPGNPLGARAMYLGSTVYRIHGTNQPSTIGKFVSSGCIGMLNDDVSDLFERVKVGTRVVVLPGGSPPPSTATASAQPMPGPNAGPLPPMSGAPGTGPTVVPPLPAPVTVR